MRSRAKSVLYIGQSTLARYLLCEAVLMETTLSFGQREWDLAYRVALKVLKAPDQAEDAAQDALLQAYSARDRFVGESRPESWLYRIARNTALTYLRRPHYRRYTSADVFAALDATVAQNDEHNASLPSKELADHVQDCLQKFRHSDRIAFTERFLLGTSERELGHILGVSTSAAKQRAFRARRAIRDSVTAAGLAPY